MRSENPEISIMTDADTIFKTLRLVPDFDGNANVLPRFIHLCDQIVQEYLEANPGNALVKLCLINGILNKIKGPAALIINSNGISENWNDIKAALINNFADQRDETTLYNDLMLATQGNSSPQEFYDRCVNLFSTIMTFVTLHETIATTVEAKRALYRKLTMQAYVRGLKEPLGSRIRCMRPDSVEKALEFVQEELNVMYLQSRNDPVSDKKLQYPLGPKPLPVTPVANTMLKPFNFPARPAPAINNNSQQPQQMWKPSFQSNQPQQYRYNVGMPSRTQQMFRAPPPNYNNSFNKFQMPQRNFNQNLGPKPMSGVSHYVARERPQQPGQVSGHDWRKSGNPPPSNYFKSKEVNVNDCASYDDNYYYSDYSYNEPEYYCASSVEYMEPSYYTVTEPNYEPSFEYPSVSFEEPEPSTSSAGEQDFQKRGKSDKSK